MSLILKTTRLILRPFQEADLVPFVAYRSDPQVAEYQGWQMPYTAAMGAEFITEMQQTLPGTPGNWYQLAVTIKGEDEVVGDVAFQVPESTPKQAMIGYSLARHVQGKGYATEAVNVLLDYLFSQRKLHRVWALCDVENGPSARLLTRVGMRREAHMVDNAWMRGKWTSEYLYAILRREWEEDKELI